MMEFSVPKVPAETAIFVVVAAYLLYSISLVVYRLYFSPLAKFPGSKLAAATFWYEFYHNYWRNGQYIFEMEKMHNKHGPIIRVNPDELSIRDAEFYSQLYVAESTRRTNAYEGFGKGVGFHDTHFLTVDHDLHRKRRKPLEPFFSRMAVNGLQSMMAEVALQLESRFRELGGTRKVIRFDHAFSAAAGDVIRRICLGRDEPGERFLDDPDFTPQWHDVIHSVVRSIPLFTRFPVIYKIVSLIPDKVLLWAYPRGQRFNILRRRAEQEVHKAKAADHEKHENSTSIFSNILNSDMPESERAHERLGREAQVLLAAGTASVARTLGVASFYILARPEIRQRLEAELKDTMSGWPDKVPTWAELEKLPFLQAIIYESLRLVYGIMNRLPRVSPDVPVQYKDYTIPIGVPVGIASYFLHTDPEVYPSPHEFKPERWIGNINPAMHRSLVSFSRGSRNCVGKNLAMAEMSLILAVLYRPNGPRLELFETDESDVKMVHDMVMPLPKLGTKGVRAVVR
ncbi:Uncharacterized protein TPAR_05573 [Tolypocladium paradoxum]|uniref:Trichodiene oxygenase n=1 Tax=Tolypocladium paradoxum TaxID=94208 RepID=A0A2S4KVL7_9HYPO|nr:Uncharacterized protein TPAR_05573 [Tolypocladium paradoxum]